MGAGEKLTNETRVECGAFGFNGIWWMAVTLRASERESVLRRAALSGHIT